MFPYRMPNTMSHRKTMKAGMAGNTKAQLKISILIQVCMAMSWEVHFYRFFSRRPTQSVDLSQMAAFENKLDELADRMRNIDDRQTFMQSPEQLLLWWRLRVRSWHRKPAQQCCQSDDDSQVKHLLAKQAGSMEVSLPATMHKDGRLMPPAYPSIHQHLIGPMTRLIQATWASKLGWAHWLIY